VLAADGKPLRLLESIPQFDQGTIRLFAQQAQQLSFHRWRDPTYDAMAALCDTLHLLAAQPLPGYFLGPVITDRKQLRQRAQRTLPAIIGR
jgi:hypothetical protein